MSTLRSPYPSVGSPSQSHYQTTRQLLRQHPDFDKVFAAVYNELQPIAHGLRHRERYCTLSTGEIVHEAYVKMLGGAVADLDDRPKFKLIAALVMREILVDAARRRRARKRGGNFAQVTLSDALGVVVTWDETLIDLDRRLDELGEADPRAAEAIDMHFFGGCTVAEIAEHQKISLSTVARDLRTALAWLGLTAEPEDAVLPLRRTA